MDRNAHGGNDSLNGGNGDDTLYGDAYEKHRNAVGGNDTLGDGSGVNRLFGDAEILILAARFTRVTRSAKMQKGGAPIMAEATRKITAILPRLPEHLSTPLFAGTTSRHFKAGQALFLAGEPGTGCYRLRQGLLKVVITSPEGDDRILAILGPGAIAGELSMIDGGPRSASVFAVKDCELSFISRLGFEEFAHQHPDIYRYLVDVLASRLRETDEAMAATSFLAVKARLARALLEVAEYLGEDVGAGRVLIRQKFSTMDLAAMAGVARENVSRALNDWNRRKIITRSSGYYALNIAALKRIVKV